MADAITIKVKVDFPLQDQLKLALATTAQKGGWLPTLWLIFVAVGSGFVLGMAVGVVIGHS